MAFDATFDDANRKPASQAKIRRRLSRSVKAMLIRTVVQVVKRRERTRRLIELGSLVEKSGLPVPPREYACLDGVGAFAEVMRAYGFTDGELELMFKENSAKALGLDATTIQ
jgi:hypothetical protein